MKLKVEYREEKSGVLKGTKDHYLICHVEFTEEERAIIQERGLYDHFVHVPSDRPLPTVAGGFGSRAMRITGLIMAPIGLLGSFAHLVSKRNLGDGGLPFWLLFIGIGLVVWGVYRDRQAVKRIEDPGQKLTTRRLLTNPDFMVHAYSLQQAREYEEEVREQLKVMAEAIRSNAAVPEMTSYDL